MPVAFDRRGRVLVESWSEPRATVEEWGFGSGVLARFLLSPEGKKMPRKFLGWDKDEG